YYQSPQSYPNADPYAIKIAQLATDALIMKEQQRLQAEQAIFREAEKANPAMDPNSDKYSREFDDAVTALWKSSKINPIDGAKRMRKLMEKSNQRAIADRETNMESKKASSGFQGNRSVSESSEDSGVKAAYNEFQQTRSVE